MTALQGLYLLVDESAFPHSRWSPLLVDCLDTLPVLVQYRAKHLAPEQQAAHARQLLKACQARGIPLLINDDPDLCLAIKADGVHLGRDDAAIHKARQTLGSSAMIGSSCYADLALAQRAEAASANYVSFGRLFESSTKPHAPSAPLEILQQASQQLSVPICGIGGIHTDNAADVRAAGATLICVAGGIWQSADPVASCQNLATICR